MLSERYPSKKLAIGLRALRRSLLDERGAAPYVGLRQLRLREALRPLQAQPALSLKAVAQQCGFGHYARFQHDLESGTFARRRALLSSSKTAADLPKSARCGIDMQEPSLQPVE